MNQISDNGDEKGKNEEVIHKINENTRILVEYVTEEYSRVKDDTSEENENGRTFRKNSVEGVDILQPDFKGNTYDTRTHN